LLRTAIRVLIVLVLAVAGALVVMQRTNPTPRRAAGWTQLSSMPQARGEVAAAAFEGTLYVLGGLRGFTTTSDVVTAYDVAADRWERLSYTVPERHHAAAAAGRDGVYVSGGASSATDWTPTRDVFIVGPRRMSRQPRMPEGRQGHAMVSLGSRLYVVGGVGPTDDTLAYAYASKKWERRASLPGPRDHLRAVEWNRKIWAIGGRAGDVLDRVDVYDPRRDIWTSGPPLPTPMSAMVVGVLGGRLHVIGGEDPDLVGGRVIPSHFSLGLGERRWHREPQVMLPVHGAGFGEHRGRLYIAGGASRQGALSTISWTAVTQSFDPEDTGR
jgi:hypothetical protein